MCRRKRATRPAFIATGPCGIDQTRKQQAVAFRRQFEERFQALAQQTFDAAFECPVGEGGTEIAVTLTRVLRSLMGFSPPEPKEFDSWKHLVHPDDHEVVAAHLQCVLSGQRDLCVFRVVMPSGSVRWFGVLTRTVWDASSQRVTHVYGLVRDYTAHSTTAPSYQVVNRTPWFLHTVYPTPN